MIPINVEITNAEESADALAALSDEMASKAVRSGLRQAAKPIATAMKNLAPRGRTGNLQASINILSLNERQAGRVGAFGGTLKGQRLKKGEVAMIIGPNKRINGRRRAKIAHFLEFGTDPYTIRSRDGFLSWAEGQAAREVQHPGIKARHFMRNALKQGNATIERDFFQGLSKHLTRVARRDAKQSILDQFSG